MFRDGTINDVVVRNLQRFADQRGWLCELFREDEIEGKYMPVMCYISVTRAGIARGPHEHTDQSDYFCFLGPSDFKLYLWDNRPQSPTYLARQIVVGGETNPISVIVPPGVVHAYRNIGTIDGTVVNCANRLYRGERKQFSIDEIRHEEDPDTIFRLD